MTAELERSRLVGQEMSHPNVHVLQAELSRMVGRGEVRQVSPVFVDRVGRGSVRIVRLKPPAPRWRRPALITAVTLLVLSAAVTVVYVVLSTLAAIAATVAGGAIVALGIVGLIRAALSGGHAGHGGKGWHWTDC